MNKPEVAPAFVVARLGYDVWLGNTRGNKYSQEHISLTTYDAAFWDFDFQTMGEGDIPGILSYIRSYHGDVKVAYIGHSQGTSQMFSELSLNQDYYADKVSIFLALGPVMRLTNSGSSLIQFFGAN